MSEVLSQGEIDALLNALNKGEVDADELKKETLKKKIRIYDFRRPNKISKEQKHTLQVIFENYARSLSNYLSAQLRTPAAVEVLSVEQITYDEFIRSIANPTILGIFSLPPLDGNAIMEINPNLGFAILDRILGGPGQSLDKMRGLTEIEETIMDRICARMLDYLEEPWAIIEPIKPTLVRIDSNPQFTQVVSPSEMVLIISLETSICGVIGMINICIPFLVIEPIINKLNVNYYYASNTRRSEASFSNSISNRLRDSSIPVRVLVGNAVITVAELLELNVGDVVPLERNIEDDMEVIIGNTTKYLAKPCVYSNRSSVRITKVIEEGDDENG